MSFLEKIRGAFGGGDNPVIQVSHVGNVDAYDRAKLDSMLKDFIEAHGDMVSVERLELDIKKHGSGTGRKKYSVHAHIVTTDSTFRSESYGWDIFQATNESLAGIRKQMIKTKEKKVSVRNSKMRLAKN